VVPDATGAPQAPHANLSVFARGLLKRLVTRVYFGDHERENERDALLRSIGDDAVRASLVASLEASAAGEPRTYRFNVVLQGANETAFLDV
jgi:protocatechuate 3,4-dioxygenase alpha subunit